MTAGAASSAGAYRVKAPWRGDSLLTTHTYVALTGQHPGGIANEQDIGVLRWDTILDDWSESVIPGDADWSETSFEDDPIMGMPLYAPVDGVIISCWAQMPDDDVVGGNCPGGSSTCMAAGNHVTILTADSKIVFLGHLMDSTIPTSVCPITDTYVYGNPVSCPAAGTGWTKLKAETVLSGNLPVVRKGDLLGEVGFSGATSDPHFHMHVKPFQVSGSDYCVGPAEALEFDESWSQLKVDGQLPVDDDWVKLEGDVPPYDPPEFTLMWPEPSGILYDSLAFEEAVTPAISVVRSATLGTEAVVAYRTFPGNTLTVASVDVQADGDLVLGDSEVKSTAHAVSIARVAADKASAVVAIRNVNSKLQLIPYNIQSDHTLDEGAGVTTTGSINLVELTHAPTHSGVVVATTDPSTSVLTVKDYAATITSTNISLSGGGSDSESGAVAAVDIATVQAGRSTSQSTGVTAFKGVVTAERRSDNSAWLRTWSVNSTGSAVAFVDDIQLKNATASEANFSIDDISVTVVGDPAAREFVVVSIQNASNDALFVQTYEVSSAGVLARKNQWDAGTISGLASAQVGLTDAMVAVRTSGTLSLLSFNVGPTGVLGRVGTRDRGAISSGDSIAVDGFYLADAMVTAALNSSNVLNLVNYQTNYSSAL